MLERVVPAWLQLLLAMLPGSLLVGALFLDAAPAGSLADGDVLANLPHEVARLALLALAVTLVFAGGGWDLATGAYALTATSKAVVLHGLLGLPAVPAAAAGLLAAAVLGACTGALAEMLRRPAWLASGVVLVAALAAIAGLAATGLLPIAGQPAPLALRASLAAPAAMVALMVALPLLLGGTVLGNRVQALRADPYRARALGVPIAATRSALHAMAGVTSGLAGLFAAVTPSLNGVGAAVTESALALATAVLGGGLGARFGVACVGAVLMAATIVIAQHVLPPWLLAGIVALLVVLHLRLVGPRAAAPGEER